MMTPWKRRAGDSKGKLDVDDVMAMMEYVDIKKTDIVTAVSVSTVYVTHLLEFSCVFFLLVFDHVMIDYP